MFICSCTVYVPAMFQDVESLRQNLDGQEVKKGVKLKSSTLNKGHLVIYARSKPGDLRTFLSKKRR